MKYFIIIDMQNDFTTGALKNETAQRIIPGIVEKAKELKAQGWKIVATQDTHYSNYMSTLEGKNLPVLHCIKGTNGWEIVDEIKPFVEESFYKDTFGYSKWRDTISDAEEVALVGTCTAICVASNYSTIKAAFPEVPITIYKDLCACVTEESHNAAIKTMEMQQAIIK